MIRGASRVSPLEQPAGARREGSNVSLLELEGEALIYQACGAGSHASFWNGASDVSTDAIGRSTRLVLQALGYSQERRQLWKEETTPGTDGSVGEGSNGSPRGEAVRPAPVESPVSGKKAG